MEIKTIFIDECQPMAFRMVCDPASYYPQCDMIFLQELVDEYNASRLRVLPIFDQVVIQAIDEMPLVFLKEPQIRTRAAYTAPGRSRHKKGKR